jgi:hypothetical protein
VINTAMNLVAGDELAWQERKAESFVLTPLYCGSESTRYRRLPESDDDEPLMLGTAVTLSGAAVTPNMGYHSSPAVTALLTIFNVRLGGWYANPRHDVLRNTGPGLGLLYLWKELFGRTNERSSYVYLSDGGHFDNLGVYELVRRRCRYIVACDAGADPHGTFEDLGNLVRKCRTDFGVRIQIDIASLKRPAGSGLSRWHCAVGEILYQDVDPGAAEGVLVYLKSSLTGDEPSDVLQFHAQHPQFPHHPTTDQFFNETKFESYRALGYHVAQKVFRKAVEEIDRPGEQPLRTLARELFKKLGERWYPPPASADENFLRSTKAYNELHEILRADANLRGLSREIYTSQDANLTDQSIAQLHVVSRMIQVMEDVWVSLKLDEYHDYPLYTGWKEVFKRWTRSESFRRHWKTLKGEYSDDFVKYCERLLAEAANE